MLSSLRPSIYIQHAADRVIVRNVSSDRALTNTPSSRPDAMPSSTTVLAAITAILLASCAPFPHQVYTTPEIQGSLSVGGIPVQGTAVLIGTAADQPAPCHNAVQVTTTDVQGRFHIAARSETDYLISGINPPSSQGQLTQVCFQTPGEPLRYGSGIFSWRSKETRINILCDPTLTVQRSPTGLDQICRQAGQ
ncbi:hypothetical protein [Chitinimonas naiadis]